MAAAAAAAGDIGDADLLVSTSDGESCGIAEDLASAAAATTGAASGVVAVTGTSAWECDGVTSAWECDGVMACVCMCAGWTGMRVVVA